MLCLRVLLFLMSRSSITTSLFNSEKKITFNSKKIMRLPKFVRRNICLNNAISWNQLQQKNFEKKITDFLWLYVLKTMNFGYFSRYRVQGIIFKTRVITWLHNFSLIFWTYLKFCLDRTHLIYSLYSPKIYFLLQVKLMSPLSSFTLRFFRYHTPLRIFADYNVKRRPVTPLKLREIFIFLSCNSELSEESEKDWYKLDRIKLLNMFRNLFREILFCRSGIKKWT